MNACPKNAQTGAKFDACNDTIYNIKDQIFLKEIIKNYGYSSDWYTYNNILSFIVR